MFDETGPLSAHELSAEELRILLNASMKALFTMSPGWETMNVLEGCDLLADTREPDADWLDRYILPEDQANFMGAIIQCIQEKDELAIEHRIIRKNGGIGWSETRAVPRLDVNGHIAKWLGTAKDITERKQIEAERAIMQAQALDERERLRATINSIDDEVWISDEAGNLVMLNPVAQHAFGLSPEGKPVLEVVYQLEILNPDGTPRQPEDSPVLHALRGETIRGEEIIRHLKTGELRYRRFNTAPIFDRHGRITGTVTVSKDITEEKQAEQALRDSEARARDLVRKLEEADRNKNRFISVLSHELRNPLATIVMAQALMKRVPPDSDQARRAAATQERQTTILTRMVEDLLDVTRISENKIQLKLERVNLVALVQQTVVDVHGSFDGKGVALRLNLPSEPVVLQADPVRLAQSVGNLLHNALKFTQPGDSVTVSVSVDAGIDEAIIRVADTGAGMEPGSLDHIFQPFVQADQPISRAQGGLGLGLSIVKGMVELHGGYVRAESDGIGKGATFTIHLPLH